ncbi:hypothetical protein K0I63_09440 [Shewanella rhizosphaerae]|uniref:hypothetical protein n=1 Tax=Shewanella TaxID=22 RepID=UPI001C65A0FF|nr:MULTISPECIES: hypothetical protein [Shewanella]QYJ99367.1 hypothetical protein K0J45_09315 [Shewanella alkalitolerans]QYK14674.1 hypothetical protein K0I63_09440 [Shewanella rhizosphaerae]
MRLSSIKVVPVFYEKQLIDLTKNDPVVGEMMSLIMLQKNNRTRHSSVDLANEINRRGFVMVNAEEIAKKFRILRVYGCGIVEHRNNRKDDAYMYWIGQSRTIAKIAFRVLKYRDVEFEVRGGRLRSH